MYTVYQHRRNDTNEIFYIGIAGYPSRPYDTSQRNIGWKNIYNKHGRKVEILLTGLTHEDACVIEIKLIAFYGRKHLRGQLCNLSAGGEGSAGILNTKTTLTGQTFGKLTVISYAHGGKNSVWNCRCKCGNETKTSTPNLKSGNTKSCGCIPMPSSLVDIVGKVYGRLTVIKNVSRANSLDKRTEWKCVCMCGNTCIVESGNLKSGHTQSCGCYLKDKITFHGLCAANNNLYMKIRRKIKKGLSIEEISTTLGVDKELVSTILSKPKLLIQ